MSSIIKRFIKYRSLNIPLLIGSAIIVLLILVSIYPEYFSPADPFGIQRLQYSYKDNASNILTPPIPPNKDYPWGTDERGRDMKSLIVYGTKQTVLIACLVALLRLIIALPIAILAAYKNRFAAWLIKLFNVLFSAIPLIIAVLLFSRIGAFNFLIKDNAIKSALWLILLGWSRLSYLLSERVKEILSQEFIEGEIAIGKSKLEIAVQNIIPHIIPSIVVMYFLEAAMVLLIMSQLGVFGMTFGGGYYTADGSLAVPSEFDWASLLQFAYLLFGSDKMWLVTYPAAAFAFSIIGFNLFGEGLRLEFEKRNSKVISFIKRIPTFFSIPKLIYEIRSYQQNKRSLSIKAVTYILILMILFLPPMPSRYKFSTDNSMQIVKELSDPKYGGRHTGSVGMKQTADYISKTLQSYGIRPLGDEYIQSFDVPRTYNINNAELKIFTADGKEISYEHRHDFFILSPFNMSYRQKIINVSPKELQNFSTNKLDEYREGLILVDTRFADQRVLTGAMMNLAYIIQPKAVLLIQSWESADYKRSVIDKTFPDTVVIHLSSEKGDELLKSKDLIAEYKVETDSYINAKGYNVLGYIPGSNPQYANECIIIGSAIDYIGDDKNKSYPGALSTGAIATQLEIARAMSEYGIKPEKTIIFGFWDGSYTDYRGSRVFKDNYVNKNNLKTYYIELTNLASVDTKKLMLDTSKSIPKNKESQKIIRTFKGVARNKDVPVMYSRLPTFSMEDFLGIEKEVLIFGSDGVNEYLYTPKDNFQAISPKELGRFGQVILDTIIEIASKQN